VLTVLLVAAAAPFLTPDGWGTVRIGMTEAQVAKALGAKLDGEALDDECTCVEKAAAAYPDMWFLFEGGKLSRISIGEKSRITTPRGIGIGATADQVRKSYPGGLMAEPHYYLPFVGVDPDWQGRGLGAALMRPILDRCDHERMAAYLEASSPRNRMLYERHGFAVTEEFFLGPGSPPLWRMWRAPR